MRHCLALLSLLFAWLLSCGQKRDSLLLKAYQTGSTEKLGAFFNEWAMETAPLAPSTIEKMDQTAQNVYSLFQQFYNPLDLQRIGGSEWGNDIYKKARYLVLQDRIRFGFVDTLDREILLQRQYAELAAGLHVSLDSVIKTSKEDGNERWCRIDDWPTPKIWDSLIDFRPPLRFGSPEGVVLTERFRTLLNQFLGNDHLSLGAGNIMSPARSKGESKNRQQFLEKYIKIWYGHWGGYWQLYSYPVVASITFDHTFSHAVINYVLVYEGGYAYFVKKGGVWMLVEARRTWIE
jgi:hypothetical protein